MIPYGRQKIDAEDIKAVTKSLKQNLITTGPTTERFEKAISKKTQSKYCVATNSATSALHVSCLALDLKKGDWLWTSPNSFVASANCALYCGAKIDFVDIDPSTYNLSVKALKEKLKNAKKLKKLPKIIIPVSFAGQSCEMAEIKKLSKIYNFKILEDSSHALGGKYKNQPIGNCKYSDITVFSFHPVKMITTGEGGVAVTNKIDLFNKMSQLRSHGINRKPKSSKNKINSSWHYEQQLLGYNYRMTDFQAALGLSQLKKLDRFISERQKIFEIYNKNLKNLPIILPFIKKEMKSSLHLYVIKINKKNAEIIRNKLINYLMKFGIKTNLHYSPIHLQPYYRKLGFKKNYFKESENYSKSALSIPVYPGLKNKELKFIILKISTFFKNKIY